MITAKGVTRYFPARVITAKGVQIFLFLAERGHHSRIISGRTWHHPRIIYGRTWPPHSNYFGPNEANTRIILAVRGHHTLANYFRAVRGHQTRIILGRTRPPHSRIISGRTRPHTQIISGRTRHTRNSNYFWPYEATTLANYLGRTRPPNSNYFRPYEAATHSNYFRPNAATTLEPLLEPETR